VTEDKFYITTTLPYVNAPPHIGFALELVQADAIARYERLRGKEVVFNTGTDEHGAKIYRRALAEGKEPQAYADEYAAKFVRLKDALNLSYTNFIRTTDPRHMAAAREFWRRCDKNGDIYKAAYRVKYCVGCELEKTDSELEGGRCPIHPNLELEEREEENYFFRFSKYQGKLLRFYEENPSFVLPDFRFNEIKKFVERGLQDFSVSRLKEKMPWGVPVPGDEAQVMYVWFDALINYVSTLGWPEDEARFRAFWPGLQIAGKDQLRQQAAMWQAMLMSAGLPNSGQILIHGFIDVGGRKMSKSLGNVVSPFEVTDKYGADALRYWLLREVPAFEDGDFTWEKFGARYNADLANGLGNFAARTLALAEKAGEFNLSEAKLDREMEEKIRAARIKAGSFMENYHLNGAVAEIWRLLSFGDEYVNREEPWRGGKKDAVYTAVVILDNVAGLLAPFLPGAAEKLTACIRHSDGKISAARGEALFPRM
jgi:methionyl-tRNA synthetase